MVTSLFPQKFRTIDNYRSRLLIKILLPVAVIVICVFCWMTYQSSQRLYHKKQVMVNLQNIVANVLENYKEKPNYDDLSTDFIYQNGIVSKTDFHPVKGSSELKNTSGYFLNLRPSDYPKKIKSFLLEYQNLDPEFCTNMLTGDWDKNYSQNMRTVIVGDKIYTWSYMQKALNIKDSLPLTPEQAQEQCSMIVGDYPGYVILEYF